MQPKPRSTRAAQSPRPAERPYTIDDDLDADEVASLKAGVPRWPMMLLIALGAALLTTALIPRGDVRERVRADAATTRAGLEARHAQGDRSSALILDLTRERLRQGDALGAEQLAGSTLGTTAAPPVGWSPSQVELLQDLRVQALLAAKRPRDAIALLEALQGKQATIERQRQLVQTLLAVGDRSAHIAALGHLVLGMSQISGGATPSEYRDLAEALRQADAPRGAIDVYDALARAHVASFGLDTLEAQLTALTSIASAPPGSSAAGPAPAALADEARDRAAQWLRSHPDTLNLAAPRLAALLMQAGWHQAAVQLLDPWLDQGSGEVTAAWTRAMQRGGRDAEAMQRMAQLAAKGNAHELLRQQVKLALESKRLDLAVNAVRDQGLKASDDAALASLSQALLDAAVAGEGTQSALAKRMLTAWWPEGLMPKLSTQDLVLAAQVAQWVGDHHEALRLADAAAASCVGKPNCAVRLARLNHESGRVKEAQAALRLADDGDIDDALLGDYANTAVAVQMAREALAKLDRQRKPAASIAFHAAWATLGVAAGRFAEVEQWLQNTQPDEVSQSVIRRIFKSALDAKAHSLAALSATRLHSAHIKPAERALLAQAMMDLGRTTDALALWRQIRQDTRAYDDAYATALTQAMSRGVGGFAEAELIQLLITQLQTVKPGPTQDALVSKLVELEAHARIVDVLETMALQDPGRWWSAFELGAVKAGHVERMLQLRRKLLVSDRAPAALRESWVSQLLDNGDRTQADMALRLLAADRLPSDAQAQKLLALWGAKATPDQLDWMEARAQNASLREPTAPVRRTGLRERAEPTQAGGFSSEARAAWMRELNARGGAARTVAVYKRVSPRPLQGPVFESYLDALTQLGDRAALATALREASRLSP